MHQYSTAWDTIIFFIQNDRHRDNHVAADQFAPVAVLIKFCSQIMTIWNMYIFLKVWQCSPGHNHSFNWAVMTLRWLYFEMSERQCRKRGKQLQGSHEEKRQVIFKHGFEEKQICFYAGFDVRVNKKYYKSPKSALRGPEKVPKGTKKTPSWSKNVPCTLSSYYKNVKPLGKCIVCCFKWFICVLSHLVCLSHLF